MTRPLRGAALAAARNTRTSPALPADRRQGGSWHTPLPETVHALLHTAGVSVAPDEQRQAVVIVLPLELAWSLAPLCPDPLQAQLACQLVTDPEDPQ